MSNADCRGGGGIGKRFKGVENFLKRVAFNLGNSPSQTEVKIISCIPIDVSDLQQKIIFLEKQLEDSRTFRSEQKRVLNTAICDSKGPLVFNNTGISCNMLDIDRGTNPQEGFSKNQLKKKSNVSFITPQVLNEVQSSTKPDIIDQQNEDLVYYDSYMRPFTIGDTKPRWDRKNLFRKKKKYLKPKKPNTQYVYYAQTNCSPFNHVRKNVPNKETMVSRSYLAEMIDKQYKPRRLGGNLSEISKFSSPICKDTPGPSANCPYESDMCSCCHGTFHNIDNMMKNDKSFRTNERLGDGGYYDSTMYDVVPVKEKSVKIKKTMDMSKRREPRPSYDIKCWPEDVRTKLRTYPIYNPLYLNHHAITSRPDIHIKRSPRMTRREAIIKNIAKRRIEVDRQIDIASSKSCSINFGSVYPKIINKKLKIDKGLEAIRVPRKTDAECLTNFIMNSECQTTTGQPETNQETIAGEEKTEETLYQIKTILQSVLEEVKITTLSKNNTNYTPKKDAVVQKGVSHASISCLLGHMKNNLQGNMQHNLQGNMQHNLQGNMQHNLQGNMQHNPQSKMQHHLQGNMQQNLQANIPHNAQGYVPGNQQGNGSNNIQGLMTSNLQGHTQGNQQSNMLGNVQCNIPGMIQANMATGSLQDNMLGNLQNNMQRNCPINMTGSLPGNIPKSFINNLQGSYPGSAQDNLLNGFPGIMPANMVSSKLINSCTFSPCNLSPYLPSCSKQLNPNQGFYLGPKCYHNFPLIIQPTGRQQCSCYRHSAQVNSGYSKHATTIATNTEMVKEEHSKETEKLIKEIYKSMALNMGVVHKDNSLSEYEPVHDLVSHMDKLTKKDLEKPPPIKDVKKVTNVVQAVSELFRKKDMQVSSESPNTTTESRLMTNEISTRSQLVATTTTDVEVKLRKDRLEKFLNPTKHGRHDVSRQEKRQLHGTAAHNAITNVSDTETSSSDTETGVTFVPQQSKNVSQKEKKDKQSLFSKMFNSVKLFKPRERRRRGDKKENKVNTQNIEESTSDSDDYQTIYSQKLESAPKPIPRLHNLPKRRTHSKISYKQAYPRERSPDKQSRRSPYLEQEYRRHWNEKLMFHDNKHRLSSEHPYSTETPRKHPYYQAYEARTLSVDPRRQIVPRTQPVNARRVVEPKQEKNPSGHAETRLGSKGIDWLKKHKMNIRCGEQWKKLILEG